jgi:hypothetical protein
MCCSPEFGELAGVLGREGTREGLGALGARFDGLDGGEAAPASGTPTTGGGDRRGCPERRASGREGQWVVGWLLGELAEVEKGYLARGLARH